MKKIIITMAAVCGISTGAFAQGSLILSDQATPGGINTITTDAGTANGWYSGTLTLEIYTALDNPTAVNGASAINASWNNSSTAAGLLASSGFVQQTIGGASSLDVTVTGGNFSAGTQTIGNSGTLTSGSDIIYAILGYYISGGVTYQGVVAFSPSSAGTPSPGTPTSPNSYWPNQNMVLTPVPEPATLALAGLSGLSLLAFRRRKA